MHLEISAKSKSCSHDVGGSIKEGRGGNYQRSLDDAELHFNRNYMCDKLGRLQVEKEHAMFGVVKGKWGNQDVMKCTGGIQDTIAQYCDK